MKIAFFFLAALYLLPAARAELEPFSTDGCSAFIDQPITPFGHSWAHCCVVHDLTYWRGGTKAERKKADRALVSCVNEAVGESDSNPQSLGWIMWSGVRIGGSPMAWLGGSPFSWRWGYGWKSESSYKQHSWPERQEVGIELGRIYATIPQISRELALDAAQTSYLQRELYSQLVHFQARHGVR